MIQFPPVLLSASVEISESKEVGEFRYELYSGQHPTHGPIGVTRIIHVETGHVMDHCLLMWPSVELGRKFYKNCVDLAQIREDQDEEAAGRERRAESGYAPKKEL